MTRINLVRAQDLSDQHLFAEWREIKMIVPAAKRSLSSVPAVQVYKKISPNYTLNTGHVTFFYNKLVFLSERYSQLTDELLQRNFDITPFDFENRDFEFVWNSLYQVVWQPTKQDIQVNIDRITERLEERPNWYRYYGDVYAPDFFIDRYRQQLLIDTLIA